jgi:hypothetical protein
MIIGFLGSIGSGKGTAGDILVKHGFISVSFANKLKDAASCIFGWPRILLEGDTPESRTFRETPCSYWSGVMGRPFTPREALQKLGTEAGRNTFHPDLWVAALLRDLDPRKKYVITDVRFPNEIEMITHIGGHLIQVSRGPDPDYYDDAYSYNFNQDWSGAYQVLPKFPDVHFSEWAWIGHPKISGRLRNESTVEALETALLTTLKVLGFEKDAPVSS